MWVHILLSICFVWTLLLLGVNNSANVEYYLVECLSKIKILVLNSLSVLFLRLLFSWIKLVKWKKHTPNPCIGIYHFSKLCWFWKQRSYTSSFLARRNITPKLSMILHLRNPAAYWRLILTVLLLFILLTGYFVRNPTSMTKNKIRLRDSCLDPMMIPGEEEHQQKLSLEFFVLHREKLLNLGKQECKIVSPIIDQIFDLELSSSRSLVINDKSFKAKVKLKHQYWRITTIIELRLQIHE